MNIYYLILQMMSKMLNLPMFLYIGNRRWQNTVKEWSEEELMVLWVALDTMLEESHDVEMRRNVVYLMEKFFTISDELDINSIEDEKQ